MKRKLLRKGLLVAALHVAIVASLGAKLVVDRATRPRAWARAAPFDPELPIRGRYLRLRIEAPAGKGIDLVRPAEQAVSGAPRGIPQPTSPARVPIELAVQDQQLVAVRSDRGRQWAIVSERDGRQIAVLEEPVAYFIAEHVPDPSIRKAGEELWVEVTIPRQGGPRPIRIGIKKNGVLTPLSD
jgi:hypothetical protein